MRRIERATAFKRDYGRLKAIPRYRDLEKRLTAVLQLLVDDRPLPRWNRDHALSGDWPGYRDCHLWPDLLLIVARGAAARQARLAQRSLRLARLGTCLSGHAERDLERRQNSHIHLLAWQWPVRRARFGLAQKANFPL
jgi:mRNA interferase YafQ